MWSIFFLTRSLFFWLHKNLFSQLLLDEYFTPNNARIDLMSSSFGREGDFVQQAMGESEEEVVATTTTRTATTSASDDDAFSPQLAGEPTVEPHFGTRFWCNKISQGSIEKWIQLREPQVAPPTSLLTLPPLNPYIPTRFDIKPLPENEYDHPLVNCSQCESNIRHAKI